MMLEYSKSGNFHVEIIHVVNIHVDLFSWVYALWYPSLAWPDPWIGSRARSDPRVWPRETNGTHENILT